MTKQIKIEELIPFKKKGWVACDIDGKWYWYSAKPILYFNIWDFCGAKCERISSAFNIAPAKDWTKSLIRIKGE